MKKAFIYCRQSSGDDDISESIEVQLGNCKKLAEKENLTIVDVFKDLNSSGKLYPSGFEDISSKDIIYQSWLKNTTTRKFYRAGAGELFKRIKEVDYIIVDDYTRLARPLTGSFLEPFITQNLIANNIKVLTVKNGVVDPSKFNDTLIQTLQNQINDNQIAIQRQKSIDGLKKLKNSGIHKQGLTQVFGYKATGKKYEIAIDEEAASIVKEIYKQFLAGEAVNKITRYANDKYFSKHGKKIFANQTRNILNRPFYSGYIFDDNGQLIKSKQLENVTLISFSDWNEVQTILNKRKVLKVKQKKSWLPLTGYIYCGTCGNRMNFCSGKDKIRKYVCQTNVFNSVKSCKMRIANSVKNFCGYGLIEAITPILLLGAIDKLKQQNKSEETLDKIKNINIDLKNLENKSSKLTDLFVKNLISDNDLDSKLADINKQKKSLNQELIYLTGLVNSKENSETIRKQIKSIIYNTISHGDYEKYVRETIKKITVYKDKIKVETYFGSLNIPRKKIWLLNELPKVTFGNCSIDNTKFVVYYYHKDLPMANIYAKNKTTLFKNNCMTIYYVD